MVEQKTHSDPINEAIETATYLSCLSAKAAFGAVQSVADQVNATTAAMGEQMRPTAHQYVEQGAATVGNFVAPIVDHPFVKYAAKVPGVRWLLAAVGQVDVDRAQQDIERLRQAHPLETPEQLAHRIVVDTAVKAGGVGLATNLVPPIALTLFGVDLAAVTALQAEMIYRIAAVYGFPLKDPSRRGEVLGIFGLSVGGSSVLKTGLSFIELIPVFGAVAGASNNAALIYGLGHLATQYYQSKYSIQLPK